MRLSPDSPAINAGDPNFVPFTNETDLDGHARVLCEGVDLGAYEMGIGDYDCNRTVDLSDFAGWGVCMTGPIAVCTSGVRNPLPDGRGSENRVASAPRSDLQSTIGCEAFDFDADGAIDLLDLRSYMPLLTGP